MGPAPFPPRIVIAHRTVLLSAEHSSFAEERAVAEQQSSLPNDIDIPAPSSTTQFLTTADASRYCGYRTTGALRKAAMEGRIEPAGRRGGTGTLMWRKCDLDSFLCDGRRRTVSTGLAGSASTHDGGRDEQLGETLEYGHCEDAVETGRLA